MDSRASLRLLVSRGFLSPLFMRGCYHLEIEILVLLIKKKKNGGTLVRRASLLFVRGKNGIAVR